jgi:hypothetical protein
MSDAGLRPRRGRDLLRLALPDGEGRWRLVAAEAYVVRLMATARTHHAER